MIKLTLKTVTVSFLTLLTLEVKVHTCTYFLLPQCVLAPWALVPAWKFALTMFTVIHNVKLSAQTKQTGNGAFIYEGSSVTQSDKFIRVRDHNTHKLFHISVCVVLNDAW